MFKQIITGSIVGIGLIFAGPALSHSSHGHHSHDFQSIQPIVAPAPRPVQHCVSGKRVNNLQAQQKRSIRKGIRQGKLVGWEIKQVKQQQRNIRKAEQRMRNSRHCLTRHEAKKLVKRLNRADKSIRNLKRNNFRAWNRHGHRHNRGHRNHR